MRPTRSLRNDSAICSRPRRSPRVHTLVATNTRGRIASSSTRSPTTSSEWPYFGELSIIDAPPSTSARSTARNGARSRSASPTSKLCQVPRPITGSSSPLLGMRRVARRSMPLPYPCVRAEDVVPRPALVHDEESQPAAALALLLHGASERRVLDERHAVVAQPIESGQRRYRLLSLRHDVAERLDVVPHGGAHQLESTELRPRMGG